jgi:ABC-type nitrate/sulfonate/bicarbonate transport system substrate-binding protein
MARSQLMPASVAKLASNMNKEMPRPNSNRRKRKLLRIGFLPVVDCAPLVMAHELGLFEKYRIDVELCREIGWGNVRDKIIHGELDAAHAPGALPFAINYALGYETQGCVAGLVLSLQGNAITVSEELWDRGVRDARSLRTEILRVWGRKTYIFGVVFLFSSQNFLLRQWLTSAGINPDTDVRIVVIPPAQMFPNLKLGNLDGYCVGEPWNSIAVQAQVGRCVATSRELAPLHPEKVLMVRRDFAEERADEHERLIIALLEACAFCDQPENRELIGETLAWARYVNAPADCLKSGPLGLFHLGHTKIKSLLDLHIFHRHLANEPSDDKAAWIVSQLVRAGLLKDSGHVRIPAARDVFRLDIFDRAKTRLIGEAKKITPEFNDDETIRFAKTINVVP